MYIIQTHTVFENDNITLHEEACTEQSFSGIDAERLRQILRKTPSVSLWEMDKGLALVHNQDEWIAACKAMNDIGHRPWEYGFCEDAEMSVRQTGHAYWTYTFKSNSQEYGGVEYVIKRKPCAPHYSGMLMLSICFDVHIKYNKPDLKLANEHLIIGLGKPVYKKEKVWWD